MPDQPERTTSSSAASGDWIIAERVVRQQGHFEDGPREGWRWVRWLVYLDGQCLGAANSEDEGWRWIEDMRKMPDRCRVCSGTNGQHDGATHDARAADLPLRSERANG